ncbi:hypothetical protein IPH25_03040 [bacterium]|nr:MAG: hypothetical protein IPG37_00030 [bacterium]QQR61442.1 MAG: hypothetical protein IPH25_03040 [bacterium]
MIGRIAGCTEDILDNLSQLPIEIKERLFRKHKLWLYKKETALEYNVYCLKQYLLEAKQIIDKTDECLDLAVHLGFMEFSFVHLTETGTEFKRLFLPYLAYYCASMYRILQRNWTNPIRPQRYRLLLSYDPDNEAITTRTAIPINNL